jgi:hypothetical protein
MRSYFADGAPGEQERNDVCGTILTRVANDREVEQSTSRIRICQDISDGVEPPASCGDLIVEVQVAMDQSPDKPCSGFAFGPDTSVAPGCEVQVDNTVEPSSGINKCHLLSSWIISFALAMLANAL